MNDQFKAATDHLVAVHGVDTAANNNTQVFTPLFDTLCHDAAVANFLPQTQDNVPLPGNAQEVTPLFDSLCRAAAVVSLLLTTSLFPAPLRA